VTLTVGLPSRSTPSGDQVVCSVGVVDEAVAVADETVFLFFFVVDFDVDAELEASRRSYGELCWFVFNNLDTVVVGHDEYFMIMYLV